MQKSNYKLKKKLLWQLKSRTAWPESLEDYIQKGALLGRKVALNRTSIPSQIHKNCSRAFEGLSYFAYKIPKKTYV